ncbi:MAG: hypothetical protein ACFNQI_03925 [Eikenella corrodens]
MPHDWLLAAGYLKNFCLAAPPLRLDFVAAPLSGSLNPKPAGGKPFNQIKQTTQ